MNLKITLKKSLIGRLPKHVQIARQLGLNKMHHAVIQPDNASIRGLVRVVSYLLHVEEIR